MSKSLLLGVALIGLTTVPGLAADLPALSPSITAPVSMMNNWSGFYLGGNVGGAWANATDTFTNNLNHSERFSYDPTSVIGGGQLGAQYQWGVFVLGIEGTFSVADLSQTDKSIVLGGGRTRSLDIDDIWTIVGRAGYAWGNWLFYGKGGWADARVTTSSLAPGVATSHSTKWEGGWTVGAGVERKFGRHWIGGLDFSYVNVGFDRTFSFSDKTKGKIQGSDANIYSVVARLSYLF